VVGVAFSPSGERIASGSNEGVLRVWEVATGSEVFEARQAREVVDVAFSPDGRWVASGGADGRAHVWDADTGARVVSLEHSSRAERSLRAVAFVEKNGRVRLATAGGGVIRAHSLVFGDELVAKACARLQRPNSNDREIDAGELGKICPNWR
jgi:WD40 repeat protein